MDLVGVEEVVLDVAERQHRQRQRRVGPAHGGLVVRRRRRARGAGPASAARRRSAARRDRAAGPARPSGPARCSRRRRAGTDRSPRAGRAATGAARRRCSPGGTSASESAIDSHSRRSVVTLITVQCCTRATGRIPHRRSPWHTGAMRRRPQLIPWKVAGRVTEQQASADEVVQATGWVFNNETGDTLTLAEFVATGDNEVPVYLERFGLLGDDDDRRSLVEIGCGIGRMTCAFTRRFGTVFACDLDAGFLERCREAVARFGKVDRLRTVEVDRRPQPRPRRPERRRRVQLHHAAALRARRRRGARRRGGAGRALRAGRSPSTSGPGRASTRSSCRSASRCAGCSGRPVVGPWLSRAPAADPAGVAGQPARPAPGHRPDPGPADRRRDLAQPGPRRADLGRQGRHAGVLRRHQPQPLVARRRGSCNAPTGSPDRPR